MKELVCRVCKSKGCGPWIDFGNQPNSVKLLAAAGDSAKLHPLLLAHCPSCGFIFIPDPLPPEAFYGDEQQPTSMFPARHLGSLVEQVLARWAGRIPPSVFEVGCNDGYFLDLLRTAGLRELAGIEPAQACAARARDRGFQVETGFFTSMKAQVLRQAGARPDLIICRHVLEHILDLDGFLQGMAELLAPGGSILLEVPDLGATGARGDFSTIWEQHLNYFDLPVLRRLLSRFGLTISCVRTVPHGGGALVAFLEKGPALAEPGPPPQREAMRLALTEHRAALGEAMARLNCAGKRVMAFGAGMRGTMLINLAGIGPYMECVLDDNPEKVGRFLPGSSLAIRSTRCLVEDPPDFCLVLPLNAKESERAVMERFPAFLAAGGRFIETLPAEGGTLAYRP